MPLLLLSRGEDTLLGLPLTLPNTTAADADADSGRGTWFVLLSEGAIGE